MKIHLLDKSNYRNLTAPDEDMVNISKCGKEIPDWAVTTLTGKVTCKLCLKRIYCEIVRRVK
jgi:hypothetical protein